MPKVIDLTLPIYQGAPTMPLDPKCAVIVHHTIDSMKYNITQLIISTHHGTHLDAPFHFSTTVERLISSTFQDVWAQHEYLILHI